MEDVTDGTGATEGQVAEGTDGSQTTQAAPGGSEGQPAVGESEGTTQGTPAETEPTFFDPKSVPDELLPAYKNMQRAFSKRMEAFSANKQKIEAYDAFTADPITNLQNYAKQYGYTLTRPEAAQQAQAQAGDDWQPQNWNEVLVRAKDMAKAELQEELGPVFREMQTIKKQGIEQQLNDIDPAWRQYEDEMMANLNSHPTLSNDAALLYKMSVPEEVRESIATQRALAKMEEKAKAAQSSGVSTTKKQSGGDLTDNVKTFNDAVRVAKKKLAEEGIAPLGG